MIREMGKLRTDLDSTLVITHAFLFSFLAFVFTPRFRITRLYTIYIYIDISFFLDWPLTFAPSLLYPPFRENKSRVSVIDHVGSATAG